MGVECGIEVVPIEQERFHELDRTVTGVAFELQNDLGRFFDERIYQEELSRRCSQAGLAVQREVLVRAAHRDFSKEYFLDLLVENSAIYELKAVEALNTKHQKQALNYLHLLNLQHGKLINFRPASVESRFVSTKLDDEKRRSFSLDESAWDGSSRSSQILRDALVGLLGDWGCFLDANLYREALLHLTAQHCLGLEAVEIASSGNPIGSQKICLLTPEIAWHLSAHHEQLESYEIHMRRLLSHTNLEAIQWINLNHQQVVLKTLQRK